MIKELKTGATRVLITIDLLARVIDVKQIRLIINYELRFKKENFMRKICKNEDLYQRE